MKTDICEKCGKVLEIKYDMKVPHVNVSISTHGSASPVYVHADLCADCFEASPGGREFFAFVRSVEDNPVEFIAPTGKIVLDAQYTQHSARCAFKEFRVCTCGLLETLEHFQYRDSWYPPFRKEWDEHVATITGGKKK